MTRRRATQLQSRSPKSIADMLLYLPDADKRRELEAFRVEFEALHGPTDLTKRYTSTWPIEDQEWMVKHDFKAYFDGLPPFAKDYFRGKMLLAAREGSLDDMPDGFVRLYVSGAMKLDHDSGRDR